MVMNHTKKIREISLKQDKKLGYGGNPQKYVDPFLPRFKVIFYNKEGYQVIDRYSGQEKNIGQAIYFYRKKPVFGLNYYGVVLSKILKASIIFNFLKKALLAGAGKSIHRGLNGFKDNKWFYKNSFSEKRGFVEGEEKIYYDKKLVYIQLYHGGTILDKRSNKKWSKRLHSSKKLEDKFKLK